MAKKKKWSRVVVWLVCTESGAMNYITSINKTNDPKIELMKYSPQLKKHTLHKSKERLK